MVIKITANVIFIQKTCSLKYFSILQSHALPASHEISMSVIHLLCELLTVIFKALH